MNNAKQRKSEVPLRGASIPFVVWLVFLTSVVFGSYHWLYWVPSPLALNSDVGKFSEERALTHVRVLSEDIGFRQVSTPGLKKAVEYLISEVRKLADLANTKRPDLDAKVDIEVVSGSIIDRIFDNDIINVYRNLTNILLYIEPKSAPEMKAFLINAHFDSAIGSPGAADCGSCVGVALETIRTLIEGDHSFPAPILLLLNGGEETLLQASHGFITQSKWRDKIGAFVNLESTGSGGGSLLFQYSTPWALASYRKGARHPRGMVLAQEFFESGVIPADTDFRMFSIDHFGRYPGIDIATVMDATSYHTDRDSLDRLRPGSTQEYGETMFGLTQSFLEALSKPMDLKKEKMVYVDVFHRVFVSFRLLSAFWIYRVPIGVLLITLDRSSNRIEFLKLTGIGFLTNSVSCVLAFILPGLTGALRVLLTDRPMVWFGNHFLAFLFFWPIALFGFLLPMKSPQNQNQISGSFAGSSLLLTVFSLYLSNSGIGSSVIPMFLSLTTSVLSLMSQLMKNRIAGLLVIAWFPCTASLSMALVLVRHIMEKISMAGASHGSLGKLTPDLVIGILNGVLLLLVLQSIAPLMTFNRSQRSKSSFLKFLAVFVVAMGLAMSFVFPYTIRNPKHVFLNHLCRQKSDLSCESVWTIASWDVIDISGALPERLQKLSSLGSSSSGDFTSIAPFHKALKGVVYPAPEMTGSGPWGIRHPRLELTDQVSNAELGTKTMYLALNWDRPGWGAMNISGTIKDWSLSEKEGIGSTGWKIVRFAQDSNDPIWSFWIEVEESSGLDLELGIYFPDVTEATLKLKQQFPQWTAVAAGTSFVSQFHFE